jgi:hypothetical protein
VRKNSIRKIISHLAEGANYISEVIVAEDVTFLNIYNKSEDEVLRLLVSKLPSMGRFICQYIKRDGSICGKGCMSELGCARHFNARPKYICPICNEETYAKTGICSTHKRIYKNAWREGKKVKMVIETPS